MDIGGRKRIFLMAAAVLAVAVIIVLHFTLRSEAMGAYVQETLVAAGRVEGIPLRIDRVQCNWWGCTSRGISIVIPHAFSYIRLDEVTLSPRPLALLTGFHQLSLAGKTYGGSLSGVFSIGVAERLFRFSVKASGLQASEIPQLSGIGISAGSVDLELKDLEASSAGVKFAQGALRISGASKPQKTALPPLLTGAPVPIEIPAVGELNLALTSSLGDGRWQITDGELWGSFGRVKLKGEVSSAKQPAPILITGRADLTSEGVRQVGMFGGPSSPRFEFRVAGTAAMPDFSMKALP